VESPAKAKTIKKFLWKDRDVVASMGHVRDLPQNKFGVDIKKDFKPTYQIIPGKKKLISELKKLVKKYPKVWLATDEDREGEAIAWHLVKALGLPKDTPRITFHEITKPAIQQAIKNPRTINQNLVDAQQGRRILDRLVGYKVSPVLWTKIKKGLSAGRVQSVAVKLIVQREREIQNFKPEETWQLQALFEKNKKKFEAQLAKLDDKEAKIWSKKQVEELLKQLWIKKFEVERSEQVLDPVKNLKKPVEILKSSEPVEFEVKKVSTKTTTRSAPAPFVTSTLQAEASRKFGRSVKQVMRVAQSLYENGYITYMRTDSPTLSEQAIKAAQAWIVNQFGKKYSQPRQFAAKSKSAQEAHEAIRPTDISKSAKDLGLKGMEAKLYELIRKRTLASQMADAKVKITTYELVPVKAPSQIWVAKGEVVEFDGWRAVWDTQDEKEQILPEVKKWEKLTSKQILARQKWTKPPARYTEASLVKKLESLGIGRPSTYAPIIATIQERWYVKKHDKYLVPDEIAFLVTDYLQKYFEQLMDYSFTAKMEDELDKIGEGKLSYAQMLKKFWEYFSQDLQKAQKSQKQLQYVGEKCPKCWGELVYRYWKYGKFVACENYPECDYKRPVDDEKRYIDRLKAKFEGKPAPWGGMIVVKIGKYGPFLTSSEYPKVKWVAQAPDLVQEALEELAAERGLLKDPQSGEALTVKKSKRGYFLAAKDYPKVKIAKPIPKELLEEARRKAEEKLAEFGGEEGG